MTSILSSAQKKNLTALIVELGQEVEIIKQSDLDVFKKLWGLPNHSKSTPDNVIFYFQMNKEFQPIPLTCVVDIIIYLINFYFFLISRKTVLRALIMQLV